MNIASRKRHNPGPRSHLNMAATMLGSAALLGGAASAQSPKPAAKPASEITVTVTNVRSGEGVVRACITTNHSEFPNCDDKKDSMTMVAPAQDGVKINFRNVAPGRYAIALLHDENNNGKADRALFMIPKEGFGFSRDAKVRMGPPKFEAAAFDVTGKAISHTIKMRYML